MTKYMPKTLENALKKAEIKCCELLNNLNQNNEYILKTYPLSQIKKYKNNLMEIMEILRNIKNTEISRLDHIIIDYLTEINKCEKIRKRKSIYIYNCDYNRLMKIYYRYKHINNPENCGII